MARDNFDREQIEAERQLHQAKVVAQEPDATREQRYARVADAHHKVNAITAANNISKKNARRL